MDECDLVVLAIDLDLMFFAVLSHTYITEFTFSSHFPAVI